MLWLFVVELRRVCRGMLFCPKRQAWFLLTPGASLMIGVATTSTRPTGESCPV